MIDPSSPFPHTVVLRPSLSAWLTVTGWRQATSALGGIGFIALLTLLSARGFAVLVAIVAETVLAVILILVPYLLRARIILAGETMSYCGLIKRVTISRGDIGYVGISSRAARGFNLCNLDIYAKDVYGRPQNKPLLSLDVALWSEESIMTLSKFLGKESIVYQIAQYYESWR